MKALVLGGTGTISRHLVQELVENGHDVTVLNHNHRSILPAEVELVVCDRKDVSSFIETCHGLGIFDCVFDMITYTSEQAQSSIQAFDGHAKRVVFCSTVDVYDKSGLHYPVTEDTPLRPRRSFDYAFQKRQCEILYEQAHREGRFETVILRPAHTYSEVSPRSHLVFHAFGNDRGPCYHLDRLRKGRPIILQGDGLSLWNSTHGIDVAHCFVHAMTCSRAVGKAYTIAGDETMTYRSFWLGIARQMGAPDVEFVCIPTDLLYRLEPEKAYLCRENYCFNNLFDTTAAKQDLDLHQTVSWQEGVRRVLAVYQQSGFENCDKPEYAFYDKLIARYKDLCHQMVLASQTES